MNAIAARAGFTTTVTRLLPLLAERDALGSLPGLAAAYRARLLERRNIVSARGDDRRAARRRSRPTRSRDGSGSLGQAGPRLDADVDPAIIGGVVARVGSTVYDGSVTTQLARMRQKLVENV